MVAFDLYLCRLERILEEHSYSHRTYTARYRSNKACVRLNLRKGYVTNELPFGCAVDADVDYDSALLDHITLQKFGLADSDNNRLLSQLGQLRVEAANRLNIERSGYNFLWVVEMPFFEFDYESGEWVAMHHPFTSPMDECVQYLDTDKGKVRAKAYDLVLNGIELSSGSIRITEPALQAKIFDLLGLSK